MYLSFQMSDIIDISYAIAQEGTLPLILLCIAGLFCLSVVLKVLSVAYSMIKFVVIKPVMHFIQLIFAICRFCGYIKQGFSKYQSQSQESQQILHAPLEGERSQGKIYAPSIYQKNKAQRKHLQ